MEIVGQRERLLEVHMVRRIEPPTRLQCGSDERVTEAVQGLLFFNVENVENVAFFLAHTRVL